MKFKKKKYWGMKFFSLSILGYETKNTRKSAIKFITIKKDYFHLINGTTDNQNIPNKNQIQTCFQGTILIS